MCGGHDVFESADLTNLGVVEPVHAFLWRVPVHKCSILIEHAGESDDAKGVRTLLEIGLDEKGV